MHTIVFAKLQINGNTHVEIMSNISVKQRCPLSPHCLAYTWTNFIHIWTRSRGIHHVYLIWWLPFYSMLNHDQA